MADDQSIREAWESHKGYIRRLYVEDRITLDMLMAKLSSQGFKATRRQYKRKLKEWGFAKNICREDAAQMLSLRQKRTLQGKPTVFEINGKSVDLDNYLKRTRAPSSRLLTLVRPSEELPRYIQCRTPPRIARLLVPPDFIRLKELVLGYYQSLDPSTASLLPRLDYPNLACVWGVAQVFKQLHLASWLFSECQHETAGRLARFAFAKLDSLHQSSFPQFLLFSLYASSMYPISKDLILHFWKYIALRASIVEKPGAIGLKLAKEVYNVLRNRDSSAYFELISEAMLKIFELDTDERVVPIVYDLLGAITMQMNDVDRWKAGTGALIRRCVHRGMLLVGDKQGESALQTYASSLEVGDCGPRRDSLYWSATNDSEAVPETSLNEWLYHSSLARIERERCESDSLVGSPRNELACYYLEKAVHVWLKNAESEPHIIMHLRMLEKWYRDDGNDSAADAVRMKSDHEFQKILKSCVSNCEGVC
ncbi:hypothetical protein E8E14_000917 [Neopestalotiopsis sp. 37M]|nr:hypothetical protein E8E14_000917 [Neopestalotiopsis sp. 37M]